MQYDAYVFGHESETAVQPYLRGDRRCAAIAWLVLSSASVGLHINVAVPRFECVAAARLQWHSRVKPAICSISGLVSFVPQASTLCLTQTG
jgi:hypothetical protein